MHFLEKERAVNKEKPWNKLGKNQKNRQNNRLY